ncbi:hypothetical protein NUW54_g6512 [Trametes sanguinea]|uniref:Uncharacterized protein n=1 Tax=Trametes sanguinea TaxID=158606 RepID=A0ACC1PU55_9APHY|nr:hypothetical protein NUW54_g6512 [Trametes sanguinea]
MVALPITVVVAALALAGTSGARLNPLHHSGAASPYFDAPSQFGISPATPPQCVVDQAAYIVRHGSRFPEPGSFAASGNPPPAAFGAKSATSAYFWRFCALFPDDLKCSSKGKSPPLNVPEYDPLGGK